MKGVSQRAKDQSSEEKSVSYYKDWYNDDQNWQFWFNKNSTSDKEVVHLTERWSIDWRLLAQNKDKNSEILLLWKKQFVLWNFVKKQHLRGYSPFGRFECTKVQINVYLKYIAHLKVDTTFYHKLIATRLQIREEAIVATSCPLVKPWARLQLMRSARKMLFLTLYARTRWCLELLLETTRITTKGVIFNFANQNKIALGNLID